MSDKTQKVKPSVPRPWSGGAKKLYDEARKVANDRITTIAADAGISVATLNVMSGGESYGPESNEELNRVFGSSDSKDAKKRRGWLGPIVRLVLYVDTGDLKDKARENRRKNWTPGRFVSYFNEVSHGFHADDSIKDAIVTTINQVVGEIDKWIDSQQRRKGNHLSDEVKEQINDHAAQIKNDVVTQVKNVVVAQVDEVATKVQQALRLHMDAYRQRFIAGLLGATNIAGIYTDRREALRDFFDTVPADMNRMDIIGSSLKHLLHGNSDRAITEHFKYIVQGPKNLKVRFMLTHPAVADLRARQENERDKKIGEEIIQSLEILKEWNVSPRRVYLWLGTPTCFAIRAGNNARSWSTILINFYPSTTPAYDNPCILLNRNKSESEEWLFNAWNKTIFEQLDTDWSDDDPRRENIRVGLDCGWDIAIGYLKANLHRYTENVTKLVQQGIFDFDSKGSSSAGASIAKDGNDLGA